jgi:hypothetical protein
MTIKRQEGMYLESHRQQAKDPVACRRATFLKICQFLDMARKSLWQLLVWFAIHKLAKIKGPAFVNHYPVDKKVSNAQPLTPSSRRAKNNQASVSNFARQSIPTHFLMCWIQQLSVHSSPSHVLTDRKPQRELTCDRRIW